MGWYTRAQRLEGPFYYRVHPKGDISSVLNSGLYSYSPAEGPGAYTDHPEMEKWPDQDTFSDEQTYRFYVADSEWEVPADRFRVRIPAEFIENRLDKDSLGDYYIDTGSDSELIVTPDQYEIDMGGGQWVRADQIRDRVMERYWRSQSKPPGYYGNKLYPEDEEDEDLYASAVRCVVKQAQTNDVMLERYMSREDWKRLQSLKAEYARVVDVWIDLVNREKSGQSSTWKRKLDEVTKQMKELDRQLSNVRRDPEAKAKQDIKKDIQRDRDQKLQTEINYKRVSKMGNLLEDDARKHFGLTDNPQLGGFIFEDGAMLSLSYDGRMRDMDHREIGEIMLKHGLDTGTDGMKQFMQATNAVRLNFNQRYAGFDFPGKPTRAQMRIILEIIKDVSDFNVTYGGESYSFYPDELEEFFDLVGYSY